MTQTFESVVRPRVMGPDGESRLLDHILQEHLRAKRVHRIVICGPRGAGKSFALRYVAERFSSEVTAGLIRLLDVRDVRSADGALKSAVADSGMITVIVARTQECPDATVYQMAAWDRDDVIEYVLQRFPDQSVSLLNRTADGAFLEGLPELWVLVLEELAANKSLDSAEAAMWEILNRLMRRCGEATDIGKKTWEDLGNDKVKEQASSVLDPATLPLGRLQELHPVQCMLAAEYFCSQLQTRSGMEILSRPIPEDVLPIIARRLRNNKRIISDLAALLILHADAALYASAMTLLLAIDPTWRPARSLARTNLKGAVLDGANWSEVDLSHTVITGISANDASFHHCDFTNAHASYASFRRTSFRCAKLTAFVFDHGFAPDSDFSHIVGHQSCFRRADLRGSNFEQTQMAESVFDSSQLCGVSFRGSYLPKASFYDANVQDADFSQCDLMMANLSHLDLTTTNLRGAMLHNARMVSCNLENVDLTQFNLMGANLRSSSLSGSEAQGANLQKVNLRAAQLGEVDWENADLRNADLRDVVFHLGASREGLLSSPYASEGTRTGFYTDERLEQHFKAPEEIRKANLKGVNLLGAHIEGVDFYLVDLRGAKMSREQYHQAASTGAILHDYQVE